MDVRKLMSLLEADGWKNLMVNSQHMGFTFDVIGEKHFTLTKWHVLVKIVPQLNSTNYSQLVSAYTSINSASKSFLWGKCFLFCVVTDFASPNVLQSFIDLTDKELHQIVRVKGGGGNIFVADAKTRQVYGTVPSMPLDVARYSKQIVTVLQQIV